MEGTTWPCVSCWAGARRDAGGGQSVNRGMKGRAPPAVVPTPLTEDASRLHWQARRHG